LQQSRFDFLTPSESWLFDYLLGLGMLAGLLLLSFCVLVLKEGMGENFDLE